MGIAEDVPQPTRTNCRTCDFDSSRAVCGESVGSSEMTSQSLAGDARGTIQDS